METISQHLWLIEDLLQYHHTDSCSLVNQFFEYIQNCLRIHPVLITIFNEDPSRPTALLFANRTDKLKELADIIRFNAHWLKCWLTDQFLSETIDLYIEDDKNLPKRKSSSSQTNIGDYENFSTDFHSTRHTETLLTSSPVNDSGFVGTDSIDLAYFKCNENCILYCVLDQSDDVIEELLETLDAVRLRALHNQYDRDYDDKLRENVTKILKKPHVTEDNTKGSC